jgi:hypothetical protein
MSNYNALASEELIINKSNVLDVLKGSIITTNTNQTSTLLVATYADGASSTHSLCGVDC